MTKTLKIHASLRGVNVVSDEAIQLCERRLAQSTNMALLTLKPRSGFTMAEILLSLTIIGVVAAITLPSLMANINERTWNTQRKALYARMSQAIAMMPSLSGYGVLTEDENGSVTKDTATETFLTEGLSKVLKINNVCDSDHLADCGVPSVYQDMVGSTKTFAKTLYELDSYGWFGGATYSGSFYSTINSNVAAFETLNAESLIVYYNPSCRSEFVHEASLSKHGNVFGFPTSNMCVNFVYDLNGNKGPNTVGKDIGFITAFNSINPLVVAPMPFSGVNAGGSSTYVWEDAVSVCTASDAESRIPNIDELSAMMLNQILINLPWGYYWSGTNYSVDRAFMVYNVPEGGRRGSDFKAWNGGSVRCIKR